jgi:hypothetical protein
MQSISQTSNNIIHKGQNKGDQCYFIIGNDMSTYYSPLTDGLDTYVNAVGKK